LGPAGSPPPPPPMMIERPMGGVCNSGPCGVIGLGPCGAMEVPCPRRTFLRRGRLSTARHRVSCMRRPEPVELKRGPSSFCTDLCNGLTILTKKEPKEKLVQLTVSNGAHAPCAKILFAVVSAMVTIALLRLSPMKPDTTPDRPMYERLPSMSGPRIVTVSFILMGAGQTTEESASIVEPLGVRMMSWSFAR
jgi:hypothetical protein